MARYPNKMALETPDGIKLRVVNYKASDGLLLDAFLASPRAARQTAIRRSDLGVIFVHGTKGSPLAGAGFLGPRLAALGYTTLSISKRNSGTNFEVSLFEETSKDIQGAVDYMKAIGFSRLALIGHSLGVDEVVHYLANTAEGSVEALVLSGTPADSREYAIQEFATANPANPRDEYDKVVRQARELVGRGKGESIIVVPTRGGHGSLAISAKSYLSYRGPESKCSAADHLGSINVPLLFLIHSLTSHGVGPEDSYGLIDRAPRHLRIEKHVVSGANHFYAGREDEATRVVADWLRVIEQGN